MADLRAELTARQRAILMAVVERYIEAGEPVSSGAVAASLGQSSAAIGQASPATIRNEMAALADLGLLEQRHTSAGRVPTAQAFRVFVERLGPRQISSSSRHEIDARFADVAGTNAVLERTSHVLALLSSGVGVAVSSGQDTDQLEHVHFSRLATSRVLAVVVSRGGVVRDRVLTVNGDPGALELETAARYLNENFRGWQIERVRAEIALRVERERSEYQRLLNSVEDLWVRTVPGSPNESRAQSVFVEGVGNLVGAGALGSMEDRERLREMLGALETKQRIADLLNAYIDARQESVRVVFDLEEQAPEMAGLVLIAAPARLAGESRGAVGVLGPTRMHYERTMNAVGYIAQVLERQGFGLKG